MIFLVLIVAVVISLLIVYLNFFAHMDCDLALWFWSKFGRKVDSLRSKVIWITGASSGIGEGLAFELAKAGAKLVLSGTNSEKLNEVKQKCLELNSALEEKDVLIAGFDMKNTDEHESVFRNVLDHFKQIDVLVNNAGRSVRASFDELDIKVDKELFDLNVFGLINLTRNVLRYWYENDLPGQIVVNSSIAGKVGSPFSSAYSGSKFALHGYFEALRLESYSRGIRITMVCPGPVKSNVLKNAFTAKPGVKFDQDFGEKSKRMATSRCAYLMGVAIANQSEEVWISDQPILAAIYFAACFPSTARFLAARFLPQSVIAKFREGK